MKSFGRPAVLCVLSGSLLLAATPARGQNLIVNGDFGLGNSGFASDYFFASTATGAQQYCISDDVQHCHSAAIHIFDHTTGTGLLDAVNGAVSPGKIVWTQTVPVTPNTDYALGAWVTSWGNVNGFDPNPAILRFAINGIPVAPDYAADPMDGKWTEFTATWNSGGASFASITIEDMELNAHGNDFALDDLSLAALPGGGSGLGGSVTGLTPQTGKILCRNMTTGKEARIKLAPGVLSWDCEQAGLVVHPGDQIRMLITFAGPAD